MAQEYEQDTTHWNYKKTSSPIDKTKCRASVSAGTWYGDKQCSRKASVDGKWCKQHSPEFLAAKQAKYDEERRLKDLYYSYRYHGEEFYNALVKISNGHNDPRALAAEMVAKIERDR